MSHDDAPPSSPGLVPVSADGGSLSTVTLRDPATAVTVTPHHDARLLPVDEIARPARIGRFAILDVLGQGGMGRVYAAYDPDLDRRIALKVLLEHRERPRQSLRVRREAHAMARLSHPNVCQVYDVGEHDGRTWIAMEYVDGVTLGAWQAEPRPWGEVLAMYARVGAGLAAAHGAGMLHRDFKPENVLVGADGRPRVIDFGLVRGDGGAPPSSADPARPVDGGDDVLHAELTREGSLMGTPAYMAPEQMEGRPLDARCDQFAFCVALYEAVYRAPPFDRRGLVRRLMSIREGPPSPPPSDVPLTVKRAIERGLSADPAERWPSMGALLEVIGADPATDRSVGVGVRIAIATVLVAGTIAVNRTLGPGLASGETSMTSLMIGEAVLMSTLLLVGWRHRRRLLATAYNRRLVRVFFTLLIGFVLSRATAVINEVPVAVMAAYDLTIQGAITLLGSLLVARWAFWPALILIGGGLAIGLLGLDPTPVFGATVLLAASVVGAINWREARRAGRTVGPSDLWSSLGDTTRSVDETRSPPEGRP